MGTDDRRELAADLRATLDARRELDPDYEPALVEAFAERLDEHIEARVKAEIAKSDAREESERGMTFVLGLVSLGVGIPITAIADDSGLAGLITSWAGIVGVNLAFALTRRRRPR